MSPISQLSVKASSARISTLGPVRRAAAFFTFLALLVLSSCGQEEESYDSLLAQQTDLYNKMAATLIALAEGNDPEAGQRELSDQVAVLRDLRTKTAALPRSTGEGRQGHLYSDDDHQKALTAFLDAERKLSVSKHNSPQIFDILSKLHQAVPVKGEGNP